MKKLRKILCLSLASSKADQLSVTLGLANTNDKNIKEDV